MNTNVKGKMTIAALMTLIVFRVTLARPALTPTTNVEPDGIETNSISTSSENRFTDDNRVTVIVTPTPKVTPKSTPSSDGSGRGSVSNDTTTIALAHQFNDTIGEPDTTDNSWFVWFGFISLHEHGIQRCVVPGSYNVNASASHNGIIIEKNGYISINSQEGCRSLIAPTPELSPSGICRATWNTVCFKVVQEKFS